MADFYPSTLATLRRYVLAILLFGLIGTTSELAFMGHYEDIQQRIPLMVMSTCALGAIWVLATWSITAVKVFRVLMLALICAGLTGMYFHYQANAEFQREMNPALTGFALLAEVVHAKAPPALAPGYMALLALFGLAAVWRAEWSDPAN
jgi:hypothetical protein